MKTQYEVNGWSKFSEEDIYSEGCILENAIHHGGNDIFSSNTVEGLIDKLLSFVGTDNKENALLNSCDDIGRIDICSMENAEGYPASKNELKQWRKGKLRLWSSIYTFYVKEVERKDVDLSKYNLSCFGYSN